MAYETLTVEGGLFPGDLLERVAAGETAGWGSTSFNAGPRLGEQVQAAFSDARAYWDAFQHRRQRSKESPTSLTRGFWVIPLLEALGYELTYQPAALQAGGDPFAISHLAGNEADAPPVHIVGLDQPLDQRGRGRSPHALVQEYLNRTDALWGLVTNGVQLRLLRNSARVTRPSYVEVDLQALVEGNRYSEFNLVYRLLHRSRLPRGGGDAPSCPLEQLYQQGIDEGGRVRDHLRDGVEAALRELGTALLAHPQSQALREAVASGRLSETAYYRQLLRLIYRLLFLFVVEERRLLLAPDAVHTERQAIYNRYYSVTRLRERCERHFAGDREGDLWQGLLATFRVFRDDRLARELGLAALGGELFGEAACRDLEDASCTNAALLSALFRLSTFVDEGRVRRRVNYAGLDVEELGSVYESLLDYHPRITLDEPAAFDLVSGSERKQTGSYYTPPALVHELIERALVPVVAERLAAAKTKADREAALLGLKVCDPASGSGHFLLAAGRRIARELAKVRTEEEEPSPSAYRLALRDVVRSCLYAVDKNPLAVDLCKVALWIEGYSTGMPLSFLDQHVKRGESLVGVFDLGVLEQGIPDDAYAPVTGDDKQAASWFKKRNKLEKEGQRSFDALLAGVESPRSLAGEFATLTSFDERTTAEVAAKAGLYAELRGPGTNWWRQKVACDLWTYAFFAPLTVADDPLVPTTETVRRYLAQPTVAYPQLVGVAMGMAEDAGFFHWPLEFPDVFAQGGFDVVLGNPPWEHIKLQEQEFFAERDPEIAAAPNKAVREKLIKSLPERNPTLAVSYGIALHTAESEGTFMRKSLRFPLCGRGDVNTYSVFAETMTSLLKHDARMGAIVPSGIAIEEPNRLFFEYIVTRRMLVSLFDFENKRRLFPAVHPEQRFCLLTISSSAKGQASAISLAFNLHGVEQINDPERVFELNHDDIFLMRPNTRTCPVFLNAKDATLCRHIYKEVPIFVNEAHAPSDGWNVNIGRMLHSSDDSRLLLAECPDPNNCLRVYESKYFSQYDHRYATFENGTDPREVSCERESPHFLSNTKYRVVQSELPHKYNSKIHPWLVSYRRITNVNNERTIMSAILPQAAVLDSANLIWGLDAMEACSIVSNLNTFVTDFLVRRSLVGRNLHSYVLKQIPVVPRTIMALNCSWEPERSTIEWVAPRVLELSYTAWDLQPLAKDLGYDGPPFAWDEERRFLLRCELDAAFFRLYDIARDDVDYIMEAFPIVRRKDEQVHAGFRTKHVILEMYDAMARAMETGKPYQTRLVPPPALGWSLSTEKAVV